MCFFLDICFYDLSIYDDDYNDDYNKCLQNDIREFELTRNKTIMRRKQCIQKHMNIIDKGNEQEQKNVYSYTYTYTQK